MDHGSYDEHQAYCEEVSIEEPELLSQLRRATYLKCIHPRMVSGPYLGRILSMFSTLIRPTRILEIGTYSGYSALCLAEGLKADGELITIEKNDELESIQKRFFDQSSSKGQIKPLFGNAIEILPEIQAPFQLIFLDADKENYQQYLPLLLRLSEKDTVILIDNMLWEGKVIFPKFNDVRTESIKELTRSIRENPILEQVLFPVRDGLMIVKVIENPN